jgi:hypothetical protein
LTHIFDGVLEGDAVAVAGRVGVRVGVGIDDVAALSAPGLAEVARACTALVLALRASSRTLRAFSSCDIHLR